MIMADRCNHMNEGRNGWEKRRCRGGEGRGIGREGTRQEKGERERRDSER